MSQGTCSVPECERRVCARGLCKMHWQRQQRTGLLDRPQMPERICSVDGCEKRHLAHGLCSAHLRRWQRHGDPLAGRANNKQGTAVERFWAKIDKDGPVPDYAPHLGPCWIWTGYITDDGYGGKALGVPAHVAAYVEIVGPVPDGLELDHLCRVHACCNPAHLEPVTHAENMRRCRKPLCGRGHDYEANLYVSPQGQRQCRACRKVREASRTPRVRQFL